MVCRSVKKVDCCDEAEVGLFEEKWEAYIPYEDDESTDNETCQEVSSSCFTCVVLYHVFAEMLMLHFSRHALSYRIKKKISHSVLWFIILL